MSVTVSCKTLSSFFLNKTESDVTVVLEPPKSLAKKRKWTPAGRPVKCFAYTRVSAANATRPDGDAPATETQTETETETFFSVPFAYGVRSLGLAARPPRSWFDPPLSSMAFAGSLHDEQKTVVEESVAALNETGSVLVSAHTGFGKCLGRGTEVLLFDGSVKKIENVVVGDVLCGDDSHPRTVLSLARGREAMARITNDVGESFTCNKSHILSLWLTDFYKIEEIRKRYYLTYLDSLTLQEEEKTFSELRECKSYIENSLKKVVDVTVEKYLTFSDDLKQKLFAYKSAVIEFDNLAPVPFSQEAEIHENALPIPRSQFRRRELFCTYIRNHGRQIDNYIFFFNKVDKNAGSVDDIIATVTFLARSLGIYAAVGGCVLAAFQARYGQNISLAVCPNRPPAFRFSVDLLPEDDYFGFELDVSAPNRRFLLADFTVTHNTVVFTKLASRIGGRVLFATCRPMLCDQALDAVKRFLPATSAQFLSPDEKKTPSIDAGADVLAVNAQNIPKLMERFPLLKKRACVVVLDEAHLLITQNLVTALLCLQPRYVIALTATPFRYDELNGAIPFFFGSRVVSRELRRTHSVAVIDTERTPVSVTNVHGDLNWTQMLSDQAEDKDRNRLITAVLAAHPARRFLVLCKRTDQCRILATIIADAGDTATVFTGAEKTFDRSARVLIATIQKCGVGFDFPELDALLLASDVTRYFLQILGRVFRRPDVSPVVFDLVDRHSVFQKHFRERKNVYLAVGGNLTNYTASSFLSPKARDSDRTTDIPQTVTTVTEQCQPKTHDEGDGN